MNAKYIQNIHPHSLFPCATYLPLLPTCHCNLESTPATLTLGSSALKEKDTPERINMPTGRVEQESDPKFLGGERDS
jgi:hypothetical protein